MWKFYEGRLKLKIVVESFRSLVHNIWENEKKSQDFGDKFIVTDLSVGKLFPI